MTSQVMVGARFGLQSPGMNLSKIVPAVLLVGFSALTAEIILSEGYTGWIRIALENRSAGILLVDLTIALGLAVVWMIRDARQRRATVWPFALLTLLLGSIGPLAYLVLRPASGGPSPVARRAQVGSTPPSRASARYPFNAARTTPTSAPQEGFVSNATSRCPSWRRFLWSLNHGGVGIMRNGARTTDFSG